jgi:hypothetical protein
VVSAERVDESDVEREREIWPIASCLLTVDRGIGVCCDVPQRRNAVQSRRGCECLECSLEGPGPHAQALNYKPVIIFGHRMD